MSNITLPFGYEVWHSEFNCPKCMKVDSDLHPIHDRKDEHYCLTCGNVYTIKIKTKVVYKEIKA